MTKKIKIKEEDLIKASKDESKGYMKCISCGCEVQMTIAFAEIVGIDSCTCSNCSGINVSQAG